MLPIATREWLAKVKGFYRAVPFRELTFCETMCDALGLSDVQQPLTRLGHAQCACREGADAMSKHRDGRLSVGKLKKQEPTPTDLYTIRNIKKSLRR